jgi:hypothetical protein
VDIAARKGNGSRPKKTVAVAATRRAEPIIQMVERAQTPASPRVVAELPKRRVCLATCAASERSAFEGGRAVDTSFRAGPLLRLHAGAHRGPQIRRPLRLT